MTSSEADSPARTKNHLWTRAGSLALNCAILCGIGAVAMFIMTMVNASEEVGSGFYSETVWDIPLLLLGLTATGVLFVGTALCAVASAASYAAAEDTRSGT